jgi:apolipoprotein N-acyltransferase
MGVEMALSPLGLHHGLLAGTQGDAAVLQVIGNFAGSAVVGFLVAYFNAMLFDLLSQVPLRGTSRLRISTAGTDERRFVPADVSAYLACLLRPLQPRAPPVI